MGNTDLCRTSSADPEARKTESKDILAQFTHIFLRAGLQQVSNKLWPGYLPIRSLTIIPFKAKHSRHICIELVQKVRSTTNTNCQSLCYERKYKGDLYLGLEFVSCHSVSVRWDQPSQWGPFTYMLMVGGKVGKYDHQHDIIFEGRLRTEPKFKTIECLQKSFQKTSMW